MQGPRRFFGVPSEENALQSRQLEQLASRLISDFVRRNKPLENCVNGKAAYGTPKYFVVLILMTLTFLDM